MEGLLLLTFLPAIDDAQLDLWIEECQFTQSLGNGVKFERPVLEYLPVRKEGRFRPR